MTDNYLDISEEINSNDRIATSGLKKEKQNLKKPKNTVKTEEYKTKECKVIAYNKHTGTLDIMFDKYGIRIKDIKDFSESSTIIIKYKGEIGHQGFEYRL